MRSDGPKKLTAAQQYASLQTARLSGAHGSLRMGRLTWEFKAQPLPISRLYRVRIQYRQGATPGALVIAPDLEELADGRDLPHVYQQRPTRICLYMPGTGEWSPDKRIVDTIVPWAVLWLFYFEDWLVTGEWSGGGEHPKVKDDAKKNSRDRRRRD